MEDENYASEYLSSQYTGICPGCCRTEMGGSTAPRSVEEGATGIRRRQVGARRSGRPNLCGSDYRCGCRLDQVNFTDVEASNWGWKGSTFG